MAATPSPQYPEWVPGVEVDHVGAGRVHLQSVWPEASLAPSSVEMTLLESLAVVLGPVAISLQLAPAAVTEHFMGLHSVRRHTGLKATGKALFRVSPGSAFATIPSGTHLRYNVDDYAGSLDFFTTEDVTIITTETLEREVYIQAAETGTVYNGIPVGSPLDTVNYILNVDAVTISEATRAGEDREDNASFEQRSRAMLSRQTSAIVYADQFEAATLTRTEVGRAFTVDNWNAATGTPSTGHVSVAVTDVAGLQLSPDQRDDIQEDLQAQVIASLTVHVIDPSYTPVNITATVEAQPGTNHADVENAVMAELARRLDPLRWDWWNTITNLDIASWIDDVPGVGRVVSVPEQITLTGVAPLPMPGDFAITVIESTR